MDLSEISAIVRNVSKFLDRIDILNLLSVNSKFRSLFHIYTNSFSIKFIRKLKTNRKYIEFLRKFVKNLEIDFINRGISQICYGNNFNSLKFNNFNKNEEILLPDIHTDKISVNYSCKKLYLEKLNRINCRELSITCNEFYASNDFSLDLKILTINAHKFFNIPLLNGITKLNIYPNNPYSTIETGLPKSIEVLGSNSICIENPFDLSNLGIIEVRHLWLKENCKLPNNLRILKCQTFRITNGDEITIPNSVRILDIAQITKPKPLFNRESKIRDILLPQCTLTIETMETLKNCKIEKISLYEIQEPSQLRYFKTSLIELRILQPIRLEPENFNLFNEFTRLENLDIRTEPSGCFSIYNLSSVKLYHNPIFFDQSYRKLQRLRIETDTLFIDFNDCLPNLIELHIRNTNYNNTMTIINIPSTVEILSLTGKTNMPELPGNLLDLSISSNYTLPTILINRDFLRNLSITTCGIVVENHVILEKLQIIVKRIQYLYIGCKIDNIEIISDSINELRTNSKTFTNYNISIGKLDKIILSWEDNLDILKFLDNAHEILVQTRLTGRYTLKQLIESIPLTAKILEIYMINLDNKLTKELARESFPNLIKCIINNKKYIGY